MCGKGKADFKLLYPDSMSIKEKLFKIASTIYGARDVEYSPEAEEQIARYQRLGYGNLPVCVAKTHLRQTNFLISSLYRELTLQCMVNI